MSRSFRFLLFLLFAPLAAACSRAPSPTAPASYNSDIASLAASAGPGQLTPASPGRRPPGHVEGDSSVSSLVGSTSCPNLSFMIGDDKIKVTPATTFVGGACAGIQPGVSLHVGGEVGPDGVITASTVVFQGNGGHPTNRFVEGNAIVRSIVDGTSCPTLSFVAEGHTIKTTAETMYSSGTCADIRPGRPLTIRGTIDAAEVVTASHIVLKGDHATEVEGDTRVTSLVSGTACPTLSFVVRDHTIQTDSATVYVGGTCSDIVIGARLQVKGLMLPDDVVVATRIMFKHETETETETEPEEH